MMFEFDQFLGFLAIITIASMGFWLLIFLMSLLPYWIGGSLKEFYSEKKEAKRKAREEKA